MEYEETHRLGTIGYDERTETWFVQAKEPQRVALTRQSLGQLVQLYNRVHQGNGLVLIAQRELRRLEESHQRHSETLRDLYLYMDRKRRRDPLSLLHRALRSLASLFLPARPPRV